MVEQVGDSRYAGPRTRGGNPAVHRSNLGRPLSPATTAATMASESLLKVVWKSRWIMLLALVLAIVAGFIYIQTATPMYTSTSKLYLDYGGIPVVQSYESRRAPQTDRYLYTQAELLVSRPILEPALETPDMRRLQTFADVELRVAYVRKRIRIDVGRRDEIISVSFDSPYAVEAAQIVNQAVNAYMDSRSESERRSSSQVLEILEEEMKRATEELNAKRDEFERFQKEEMPLGLGSDQGSDVVPRYQRLESHYTQAQIRTLEAASFLEGVKSLADDPVALTQYLIAKGYASVYTAMARERTPFETDLATAERQLHDIRDELTPDNPKILGIKAEIERISTKLDELDRRFVDTTLAAAEQEHREVKSEQDEAAALLAEQREKVVDFNAEIAKYRRFDAEVVELAAYSQTKLDQIREIRTIVGEDVGQLRMEILETAQPAQQPSSPQKAKVMAIAMMLGLFMGGGLAVLRDLLDQTLRSGDEISALLGLSVLGIVPAMSRRQSVPARGQKVHLLPDSSEAEAFRTVRTAILFGVSKGKAKTMLVTSPASGDGKSTLVSNLAIAMAQTGQKTVIVDADFRRPMQHVIFELSEDEGGLSELLAEKMDLEQAVHATKASGLSVLPCGGPVSNPAEILNSHRFKALLEQLAEVYDRVIIDAPPVTVVTDAQILGAICDVSILVLRAHKSTRKIGQRALESLQSVGAHLLGVVVNDVRRSSDSYGYYGSYADSNGKSKSGQTLAKAPSSRRVAREKQIAANVSPKGVRSA
jgi:polysaccharide biosynthesis transport protein